MRFFDFLDASEKVPAKVHMQLLDLARILTRNTDLQLNFGPYALYDESRNRLTVSTFWEHFSEQERLIGMKSDVHLRAIGSAWFSSAQTIGHYLKQTYSHPSLAKQLFALCEDVRLEHICLDTRPGTRQAFSARHRLYHPYATEQRDFHERQGNQADILLLSVYQILTERGYVRDEEGLRSNAVSSLTSASESHPASSTADILPPALYFARPSIDALVEGVLSATSTQDIARECTQFLGEVSPYLTADVVARHFVTSEQNGLKEPIDNSDMFDTLARTNKLDSDVSEMVTLADDEHQVDEQLEIWHRETKEEAGSVLKMNMEHGAPSNLMGDVWREGEDEGAKVSDVVQGRSQSGVEQSDTESGAPSARMDGSTDAKTANKLHRTLLRHRFLECQKPSDTDIHDYTALAKRVAPLKLKLKHIVEDNLERKMTQRRTGLLAGRLGNRLVPFVIDPTPRLFYKKENPFHDLDAAFILLVDCSGSMYDRMDETRIGVTLFHETLKSLRVPHSVVGFWEDIDGATSDASITFFQPVIEFEDCLKPSSGPAICHLDAHLDNRDGYAIRILSKQLGQRSERRKFLIVFSDGDPAAMNYEDQGVYDTHQAVMEARRGGIQVMNVFFTDANSSSSARKLIQDIYGMGAVSVSDVEEVIDTFAPVLRKLLATVV